MRRTWGLATAAVLAAGTFGVQAGDASAQTARDAPPRGRGDHGAPAAPRRGPGHGRPGVPGDGHHHRPRRHHARAAGTHPRRGPGPRRRPRRAPRPRCRLARASARPSPRRCTSRPRPTVTAAAASARALAPARATRAISGCKAEGSPRLVVDATGAHAAPGLGGPHRRRPEGRHAQPPRDLRRRAQRRRDPARAADRDRRRLGPDALQRHRPAAADPVRARPTSSRTPTPRQHVHDRHEQQVGLATAARSSASAARPARCSPARTTTFGNGTTSSRESAARRRAVRHATRRGTTTRTSTAATASSATAPAPTTASTTAAATSTPSGTARKMTYGDGDGTSYGPLVSLDVAGHEMSHGVTENTAGLDYSGESGGLNEATSDIFGTMVEFYANNANDPGDYLIGEEFDLAKHAGLPARWTSRAATARSYDCWSVAGRPGRRALLLGRGQPLLLPAVRGLGRQDPERGLLQQPDLQRLDGHRHRPRRGGEDLVPRADGLHDLQHELLRCAHRDAERGPDLYGAGSTQYNAVAAAWSAVSVS